MAYNRSFGDLFDKGHIVPAIFWAAVMAGGIEVMRYSWARRRIIARFAKRYRYLIPTLSSSAAAIAALLYTLITSPSDLFSSNLVAVTASIMFCTQMFFGMKMTKITKIVMQQFNNRQRSAIPPHLLFSQTGKIFERELL